jgi:uncharacterized protein YggE
MVPALAQDGRIRVIGRAVVETVPDFVTVRVGVASRAPTPTAALDQTSASARKIIDFAKKLGINERDMQTDAVNLSQTFKTVRDPNGGTRQEPDGYAASNDVRVKLDDLSRLGTFMRQVLDQGATNIGGVQFGLVDPDKAADEARLKAVEDAVRQAQGLADAAKVKLGRIQDIVSPPRAEYRVGNTAMDMPVRRARGAAVPLEAGTLQVSAEVEIVWAVQ